MTSIPAKSRAMYSFMLLAYPSDFRRRFGGEMMDTFSDQLQVEEQDRGVAGVLRVWRSAFWETISVAVPLQLRTPIVISVLLSLPVSSAICLMLLSSVSPQCHK
jgi:hypothetical protein